MNSDLVSAKAVATTLGVSVRTVQRCMSGKIGPGLASITRGSRRLVSLSDARQYIERHSRANIASTTPEAEAVAAQLEAEMTQDPEKVLVKLATSPSLIELLGSARARVMVAAAEAYRRAGETELKARGMLTPEQFVKDLRAAAYLFAEHIEGEGATRLASKLISFIRTTFGVDLAEKSPSAYGLLEKEIREDHNCSLRSFCKECEEKARGEELLHGFGVRSTAETAPIPPLPPQPKE